jgi:formylmethanofuran dehydrogenase subunit E
MSEPTHRADRTNWQRSYDDVPPIRIRDPVAEALTVLDPGDPFVVSYEDVVMTAGHSCPTAAGAYRLAQLGLDALYPDDLPVRGDVAVRAGGPRDDPSYGVTSRIVSYITGAAGEDGFAGLAGGYGGRRRLLSFADVDSGGVTFAFRRTDTDDAVDVTYRVADVPDAGPATQYLRPLVEGEATPEERAAFAEAWHGRVHAVLTDDSLFDVAPCSSEDVPTP